MAAPHPTKPLTLLAVLWLIAAGCPPGPRPTAAEAVVALQIKSPTGTGTGWRTLAPGDTLHSGERFGLRIEVTAPVYLHVAQRSTGGQAVTLWPAAGAQAALASPGRVTQLPATDGGWFQLDEQPGEEDIYVVASRAPVTQKEIQRAIDGAPRDRGDPPPTADGKNKRDANEPVPRGYDQARRALVKPLDEAGLAVLRFWIRHE